MGKYLDDQGLVYLWSKIKAGFATKDVATTSANGLMSSSDKTKLNGIATGAEVNQNAFSNVKVGSTTVAADSKTDTLELVAGTDIRLTPDATNDKITISVGTNVTNLEDYLEFTYFDGVNLASIELDDPTLLKHYGTCNTDAATEIKDVSCTGFKLYTGSWIAVKFTVTNSAAVANVKLRVNSTNANDAKNIKYRGGNLPSAGSLAVGRVYFFVYDGTNWEIIGDLDTNTTYSGMSQSEANTGTSTTNRLISPKVLRDTISSYGGLRSFKAKGEVGGYTAEFDVDTNGVDWELLYGPNLLLETQSDGVGGYVLTLDTVTSPDFTAPTANTASSSTNNRQIATTAFVHTVVDAAVSGQATFKGAVTSASTISSSSYKAGWYWLVNAAGTYFGNVCEVGDMIYAIADKGSSAQNSDFTVVQNNLDLSTISNSDIDAIVNGTYTAA